ncbi:UDP-glucose:2-hydroxyflavanone C-glucosyltransferase-like [Phoenix dactylifera]|uniref:Glycosyltransferase n=1 Tax=Phoenix dactylifera TaxID=42345 RepID=A0A8B7C557_PHODC|nr:UDP-glucose:2-hydroxyflavanone C-glucosyltransferase-like [Phoenix dactylifera]
MSSSSDPEKPHLAFLPSAGMGHLKPFCSLAAALSERGCDVSFITVQPTVSAAESCHIADFFAAFPRIRRLDFDLVAYDPSGFASTDPFFLRVQAIRGSAHLLPALLASSSPPFSALVIDIFLASTCIPIAAAIGLPSYIWFISSAAMLSLLACFPTCSAGVSDFEIPGLWRVPKASIPRALHNLSHPFTTQFVENGRILPKASGILVNTFEALEPVALAALNRGKVAPGLPPVIAIGPLQAASLGHEGSPLSWLHGQPARSVVYVCFGNRTAMSKEQIRELGVGLEKSGCRFLWVAKSKIVDREDGEVELEGLLGEGYLERVKHRGLVVKGWVDQEEILRHRAIGGFLSHCGWNSLSEAALHGVRVLGWPRGGDQRVNAEVVARSGLGIWVEWSWDGEEEVVMGEEIGERVRQLMEDDGLQASAARLGEEAVKAVAADGSSGKGLAEFIGMLKMR